jgi:hypothetical protein
MPEFNNNVEISKYFSLKQGKISILIADRNFEFYRRIKTEIPITFDNLDQ